MNDEKRSQAMNITNCQLNKQIFEYRLNMNFALQPTQKQNHQQIIISHAFINLATFHQESSYMIIATTDGSAILYALDQHGQGSIHQINSIKLYDCPITCIEWTKHIPSLLPRLFITVGYDNLLKIIQLSHQSMLSVKVSVHIQNQEPIISAKWLTSSFQNDYSNAKIVLGTAKGNIVSLIHERSSLNKNEKGQWYQNIKSYQSSNPVYLARKSNEEYKFYAAVDRKVEELRLNNSNKIENGSKNCVLETDSEITGMLAHQETIVILTRYNLIIYEYESQQPLRFDEINRFALESTDGRIGWGKYFQEICVYLNVANKIKRITYGKVFTGGWSQLQEKC